MSRDAIAVKFVHPWHCISRIGERGYDMSVKHMKESTGSRPIALFGTAHRHAAASYEGALAETRLRAALARERALRRQLDALAQQQQDSSNKLLAWRDEAAHHFAKLSRRQRQIMDMVLTGHPSKNIAADLGINQRTVESHRAAIMKKTGSKSLPALTRLAMAAAWSGVPDSESVT